YGAVSCLTRIGVVDAFCFGSESGELGPLQRLAEQLAAEPDAFAGALQEQLKTGVPFPSAYAAAVAALTGMPEDASILAEPNQSLGFHYLLARERLGSRLTPLTI